MESIDLKNRHYRLTEDTEQNIRAAEMMSKLLGVPTFEFIEYALKETKIYKAFPFMALIFGQVSLVKKVTTPEISYSELEGLYMYQYHIDASELDAKYEDGKNAEESERKGD